MNIIQWNINGFRSHLEEVKLILKEHKPKVFCIQKTKVFPSYKISVKGFDPFRSDNLQGNNACGGVLILVDSSLNPREVPLTTNLQATCISISFPCRMSICSVYLPPSPSVLYRNELVDLILQLPQPFLLLGDFHGHHHHWGSPDNTPRGNMIVKVMEDLALIALNDGSPTHMCPRTGNWSHLDLSIASPSLAHRCDWSVLADLYGSDHAPVLITVESRSSETHKSPRWILEKADWSKFANELVQVDNNVPLNTLVQNFTN